MSLKFSRIQPWSAELAALDQFKKSFIQEYSKYFDDLLSGERSLPFGLLVFFLTGYIHVPRSRLCVIYI